MAKKKETKPKSKTEKKQEAKQKAASNKIVKKMGDKGRYDDANQMKTLVVMQVLGDTKSFFDNQAQLQDKLSDFLITQKFQTHRYQTIMLLLILGYRGVTQEWMH